MLPKPFIQILESAYNSFNTKSPFRSVAAFVKNVMNHFPLFFHHLKTFNQGKVSVARSVWINGINGQKNRVKPGFIYKSQIRSLYLVLFYPWLPTAHLHAIMVHLYAALIWILAVFLSSFFPWTDSLHLYRLLHPWEQLSAEGSLEIQKDPNNWLQNSSYRTLWWEERIGFNLCRVQ